MKWDDLRLFLAVAEAGTLAGAARQLDQNHSTVFRRLNNLESTLDTRLFERWPEGYVLTPVGERMLDLSRQANNLVEQIEREVAGRDMSPAGIVRMTTAPNIATNLLPPFVEQLRKNHPDIVLEISVGDTDFDLSRREADIALRATPKPPESLIGRHLADLSWWVCGPQRWRRDIDGLEQLGDQPIIGGDLSLQRLDAFSWLERNYAASTVARCSDLPTVSALVAQGVGLSVLPSDHADNKLRRLFEVPDAKGQLWLLMHPDLRRTHRVQVVWQALIDTIPSLLQSGGATT